MRGRIKGFDALFLFFILALCFSVGYGAVAGRGETEKESLTIELTVTKSNGGFGENEAMKIDGRIAATLVYLSKDEAIIRADATPSEAGWMLSHGKYISENQPIKFYSDTSYLEGRIKRISKSA